MGYELPVKWAYVVKLNDDPFKSDAVEVAEGEIGFAEAEAPASDVLDVRVLPPPRRHALIFGRLAKLLAGEAITLVNDHDPKPLHYQLEATQSGQFGWDYLEQGPEAWRVRIAKKPA
jgi:uncharacterized protein (DUF2249 family)